MGTKGPVRINNRQLVELASKQPGVIEARIIRTEDVVTGAWVEWKCRFGCDGYGQCLVCPPYTPRPEQTRKVLDDYRRALLIHFSPKAQVKAIVAELERTVFLMGAWKAFGLGAGPCYFCSKCPVPDGPCRHPERARPSMEACGIDVYSTVHRAGLPLEVVRSTSQCPNYYGLLLVD
ncbi:MAG: DUF2284 domain-containing protein [Sedimentisphaerales bacterium]|nr:DUF2284 domain-containing protein [Sedimentisphaerales bacterium]